MFFSWFYWRFHICQLLFFGRRIDFQSLFLRNHHVLISSPIFYCTHSLSFDIISSIFSKLWMNLINLSTFFIFVGLMVLTFWIILCIIFYPLFSLRYSNEIIWCIVMKYFIAFCSSFDKLIQLCISWINVKSKVNLESMFYQPQTLKLMLLFPNI